MPRITICRGNTLLVVVGAGGLLRFGIFNLAKRTYLWRREISCVEADHWDLSPDGKHVATTAWESGAVTIFDVSSGGVRSRFHAREDSNVYLGSCGVQLVCSGNVSLFDFDGRPLHEWQPSGEFRGATPDTILHAECGDVALRRWTGESLGRLKLDRTVVLTDSTAEGGGRLVFGEMGGPIHCFDKKRGGVAWRHPLPEGIHATRLAISGERIHAICRAFENERGGKFIELDLEGRVLGEWTAEYPIDVSFSDTLGAWVGHRYEIISADGQTRTFIPELAEIAAG
jgi:hypothetical protein